jgi:hypothetical protein
MERFSWSNFHQCFEDLEKEFFINILKEITDSTLTPTRLNLIEIDWT